MTRLALSEDCSEYKYNKRKREVAKSRMELGHLKQILFDIDGVDLLIADFGVNQKTVKKRVSNDQDLKQWIDIFEENTTYELRISGYSDCIGNEANNILLRRARAKSIESLLGPSARSRVVFAEEAPEGTYVSKNDTVEGRARNRSVVISYSKSIDRSVNVCQDVAKEKKTLEEYIQLIRCIEKAYYEQDPREMLSLLRQRYQGAEKWSCAYNKYWPSVIPCSKDFSPKSLSSFNFYDPRNRKDGWYLLEALCTRKSQAAQIVGDKDKGIDMGHVFTGLEAMTCPQKSIKFPGAEGDYIRRIRVTNEAFATWAGDLGSAVGQYLVDQEFRGSKKGLDEYFRHSGKPASEADLLGDIDCYSIRCGLLNIDCENSRMKKIKPFDKKISKILAEYYLGADGPLAGKVNQRFSCFWKAMGGAVILGNHPSNPKGLSNKLYYSIFAASKVFYSAYAVKARGGTFWGGKVITALSEKPEKKMRAATREISDLFVDWLQIGMKQER